MKSLFLALLMCFPVAAQDFNLDNFVPLAEDSIIEPLEIVDPIDISAFDFDSESKARLDEMKRLSEEIKKIAEEIKESNKKITTMTFDDTRLLNLEDRVTVLEQESLNYVTTEDVKVIVKEEVEKHIKLTLKTGNIIKEVDIPLVKTSESVVYNKVSIPGYYGTFDVPNGAVITHVDGVPVNKVSSVNNTVFGYTNQHFMQGVRKSTGWSTRIAQPVGCRFVNGVLQCN
jgi:hypothetical protein